MEALNLRQRSDHIPLLSQLPFEARRGETLTSISRQYGVSVYALATANSGIVDPDLVFIGQLVNIPARGNTRVVKQTGYFLVLVPLSVFCIRCITAASYTQLSRALRHESQNNLQHQGSTSGRWRSALSDMNEPDDVFNTESNLYSNRSNSEDEAEISLEMSESYVKLEHDYRKFLAQCGISKYGYWRGGTGGSTELKVLADEPSRGNSEF